MSRLCMKCLCMKRLYMGYTHHIQTNGSENFNDELYNDGEFLHVYLTQEHLHHDEERREHAFAWGHKGVLI